MKGVLCNRFCHVALYGHFCLQCSWPCTLSKPLVYRQCNMPEMQATIICNFFEKKNVHNLVTDFMVFLDLFTGKNSLMNVQVQVSKKMLHNHCELLYQFLSLLPPTFFLFFVFAFCLLFFTFSWFFNTSLPGIFTLPSSFNSMLILVLSFCHLVEKYLLSLCSISLMVS